MRKRLCAAALGVAALCVLAAPAVAGSQAPKEPAQARSKKARSGKDADFTLHGVRWVRGLDVARAHRKAAARPVLWLRVLGDPTGNT